MPLSRALGGVTRSRTTPRQVTGQQKRSCTPASARAPCGEGSHRAPREAGEQPEKSCATSSTGYSALVEQALHPCSSSSRLASRGPGGPKRVWNRRLGGGWLGRQRQRIGRPHGPASSPESAEPPRAARGGEAARVGPGRCREGRLAMLRGPMSSHSLAPVSITWPSVYSLSAAEMRLELMRWPSAWVSVDSSSCSHTQSRLRPYRHPGYSLAVCGLSDASRPRASTAYGRRPWRTRSLARPHAVVGSGRARSRGRCGAGSTCASASATLSVRISCEPQTPCTRHVRQ